MKRCAIVVLSEVKIGAQKGEVYKYIWVFVGWWRVCVLVLGAIVCSFMHGVGSVGIFYYF